MKTPLLYGFLCALGGMIVTLLLFFTGFHDSPEKLPTAQWVGGLVGLVILVTCLALAMRDKRAAAPADAPWGYGSAYGAGIVTMIFITLFSAISTYLYFGVINPHMAEVTLAAQQAKLAAQGKSEAQIAAAEDIMKKFVSPVVVTCFQAIGGFLFAAIVVIPITAIFFKNPRPVVASDEPPPIS